MAQQRSFLNRPSISVVIPTLNEQRCIGSVLKDLYLQSRRPDHIIIVDGGSTDNTEAVIRIWSKFWPRVQFVEFPHRGVGAQRDFGGTYATKMLGQATSTNATHLLYFFDADIHIPKHFIASTAQKMQHEHLDAACPHYQPLTEVLKNPVHVVCIQVLFAFLNGMIWFGQQHFPAGAGSCIIVTAEHFKKIGGFTASVLVDDLDFVHRAGKTGRFKILPFSIYFSTRRFAQYGVLRTAWQYLQIGWFFLVKRIHRTNQLQYEFGKFDK